MGINGFYIGYMTSEGFGVVVFVFKDGQITGVDAGGVKFDGAYKKDPKTGGFVGEVQVSAPPNIAVVQGRNTGPNGLQYEVQLNMPANFLEVPFFKVDTPFGPVNVKLERVRDLGALA